MPQARKKRRNGKASATKTSATRASVKKVSAESRKGADEPGPPFFVTKKEELELRIAASRGVVMNGTPTSLVIGQPTSFDDYVRQLMIPTRVLELARKATARASPSTRSSARWTAGRAP